MLPTILDENSLNLQEKWLCLDFVNTVDWHASDQPEEWLKSYADLAGWAKEANLISESRTQELLSEAAARPEEAHETLGKAIALRESIYRLFLAHLRVGNPQATDLKQLNDALSEWFTQLSLELREDGFRWAWKGNALHLGSFLGPIAQSAASLLTSPELARVGICADATGCGWLFYDTSRNHSRRWCDMQGCGNRSKARQHYVRKKQVNPDTIAPA